MISGKRISQDGETTNLLCNEKPEKWMGCQKGRLTVSVWKFQHKA
jgi:hypothetical protein